MANENNTSSAYNANEDMDAAVIKVVEMYDHMEMAEIIRAIRREWEELECELVVQPSADAICRAVDRCARRGAILVEEHHDERAREGGCPALYRSVS